MLWGHTGVPLTIAGSDSNKDHGTRGPSHPGDGPFLSSIAFREGPLLKEASAASNQWRKRGLASIAPTWMETDKRAWYGTARSVPAIGAMVFVRSFGKQENATGGKTSFGTFTMWARPFNHLAAVAAAIDKAAELRSRARMLGLAKLTAVANRVEMTKKQQQLEIRQRGLEQFIEDPYPNNSLFHIGFDRDRRVVLEAGIPR